MSPTKTQALKTPRPHCKNEQAQQQKNGAQWDDNGWLQRQILVHESFKAPSVRVDSLHTLHLPWTPRSPAILESSRWHLKSPPCHSASILLVPLLSCNNTVYSRWVARRKTLNFSCEKLHPSRERTIHADDARYEVRKLEGCLNHDSAKTD